MSPFRQTSLKRQSSGQRIPVKRARTTRPVQPRTTIPISSKPRLELKQTFDFSPSDVVVGAGVGYIQLFGRVDGGSGDSDRNGKLIRHNDYEVRWRAWSDAGNSYTTYRVITGTIGGKLVGSTPPPLDEILNAFNTVVPDPNNVLLPYETENSKNIRIDYDQIFNYQASVQETGSPPDTPAIVEKIHTTGTCFNRFEQEYTSSSEEDVANRVHFIAIIAGASNVNVSWHSANRFIDI